MLAQDLLPFIHMSSRDGYLDVSGCGEKLTLAKSPVMCISAEYEEIVRVAKCCREKNYVLPTSTSSDKNRSVSV